MYIVQDVCLGNADGAGEDNRNVARMASHSIAVAGGVESMTRAPYVLPKSDPTFPATRTELYSTTLG